MRESANSRKARLASVLLSRTDILAESNRQENSPCADGQITFTHLRHPVPPRGAARDRHERGAGSGGRWSPRMACAGFGGRRSRVVLTPRRWRSTWWRCLRIAPGMVTTSPVHQGERGV